MLACAFNQLTLFEGIVRYLHHPYLMLPHGFCIAICVCKLMYLAQNLGAPISTQGWMWLLLVKMLSCVHASCMFEGTDTISRNAGVKQLNLHRFTTQENPSSDGAHLSCCNSVLWPRCRHHMTVDGHIAFP